MNFKSKYWNESDSDSESDDEQTYQITTGTKFGTTGSTKATHFDKLITLEFATDSPTSNEAAAMITAEVVGQDPKAKIWIKEIHLEAVCAPKRVPLFAKIEGFDEHRRTRPNVGTTFSLYNDNSQCVSNCSDYASLKDGFCSFAKHNIDIDDESFIVRFGDRIRLRGETALCKLIEEFWGSVKDVLPNRKVDAVRKAEILELEPDEIDAVKKRMKELKEKHHLGESTKVLIHGPAGESAADVLSRYDQGEFGNLYLDLRVVGTAHSSQ